MRTTHVIWDWNGTLLDDTRASLAAFNQILRKRALPEISLDFYRTHFAFPVKPFYEASGIRLEDEDWDALAREYHANYAKQDKALNAQARQVLQDVRRRGIRQSVLSVSRQDLLEASVAAEGLTGFFDFIYGVDNLNGGSKQARACELLATLAPKDPSAVVLVGDATHDCEVAERLGVRCVLCAQGGHSFARLQAVAPTVHTLMETLELI